MENIKIRKHLLVLVMLIGVMVLSSGDVKAAGCSASTTCGSTCSYGGVTYSTVLIGTQCWFKENLNVGIMLENTENPDNTAPILNEPNTVSKWCFYNSSTYCANEGGLYTWAEANALPNSCNSASCTVMTPNQGICPTGWHIPTDTEFYTLESYLTIPGETCDETRVGWDCFDAGTKLKLGGSSGFDAISAGNLSPSGDMFDKREPSIHIWSSLPLSAGLAYKRTLALGYETVGRWASVKAYGFSVRCLFDTAIIGPPTNKGQCKRNGWKTFNNPTFKNQGNCIRHLVATTYKK